MVGSAEKIAMKILLTMFALMWVTKSFFTVGSVAKFLNTLPAERQLEAKIIAMDVFPIIVFYRIEQ